MSFILDALKKLEQKRHRSTVPNLLTIHSSPKEKPKKRSAWVYLLAAALLLNAGILMIWLHPWRSEKTAIAKQSTDIEKRVLTMAESGKEVSDVPVAVSSPPKSIAKKETGSLGEKSLSKKEITASTPAVKQTHVEPQGQPALSKTDMSKSVLAPDTEKGKRTIPAAQEKTPVGQQTVSKALPDINSAGTSEQKIFERNELPASIQQELPNLSVTGHIYSNDPSSRIVNINGQILRDGETVTAGLKLEEITENGVVLNYKGYRFRMRGF